MGRALAIAFAWILLGIAPVFAQGPTLAELQAQLNAIRAKLGQESSFEEGRVELHGYVEALIEDEASNRALLYSRAKELAENERYTPDVLDRAYYFEVAAGASRDTGSVETALRMHKEQAKLLVEAGDIPGACAVLRTAVNDNPEAREQPPHLLASLADYLRRDGKYKEAEACTREIEALVGDDPDFRDARVVAVLVRAFIQRELGFPESALPELEQLALELESAAEPMPARLNQVRLELLAIASGTGDHRAVRERAQALLADASIEQDPIWRARVLQHYGVSLFEKERNQRHEGEAPALAARALLEEALTAELSDADRLFIRTRLLDEAIDLGDAARAREQLAKLREIPRRSIPVATRVEGAVAEAHFALTLGATPVELDALRRDLLEAFGELSRTWRDAPRDVKGVAFLKYPHRRGLLSSLCRIEVMIRGAESGVVAALEHMLATQELSTLASSLPADRPISIEEVRESLLSGPDHGLLLYLPARDVSLVFAIDHATVTLHPLARNQDLSSFRQDYVAWLLLQGVYRMPAERQRELARVERERARKLADALLPAEVRERIASWRRLSIGGTDSLGQTPFAWLPFGEEPYLGLRLPLDYVPSIPHSTRRVQRSVRRARETALLLVNDTLPANQHWQGVPDLLPADLGAERINDLQRLYGAKQFAVLQELSATVTALREVDFDEVAVLQLLVHTVEEPDREIPVSFVLTPEDEGESGLLASAELAQLQGAPEVVVLSGCGSGQGPTRRGDPLVASPIGAWLAKGSRAVIASHHQLTLDAARRTTEILHHEWARGGVTAAEAMLEVRRDLVESDGAMAPFLHAMQQVVGLGHEVVFEDPLPGAREKREPSTQKIFLLPLLLAAVLVFARARYRRRARANPG